MLHSTIHTSLKKTSTVICLTHTNKPNMTLLCQFSNVHLYCHPWKVSSKIFRNVLYK